MKSDHTQITRVASRCPMCGKAPADKYKPFCSSRCSMLDLGKWLGEGYRLQTEENDDAPGFAKATSGSGNKSGENEE
ncbi:MAG: DNA gyrase inhibitor YacG [Bdellovibrionales bacterium]